MTSIVGAMAQNKVGSCLHLLISPSSTTAARQAGSRRIPITNIFHHTVDIAFYIFEAL